MGLTEGIPERHAPRVKARDPEPDDDIELPPAEAARDRRRDHDLRAVEREGMRTGLAKQFKQVLDAQARRAKEAEEAAPKRGNRRQAGRDGGPQPPNVNE